MLGTEGGTALLTCATDRALKRPRPPPLHLYLPQRRLARHEEAALSKYYDLDRRLRGDPRLALLLAPA
jgi:hypothetical protein